MSLIHTALKREQRKRSEAAEAAPPAIPAAQPRERARGNKNTTILLILCGGGILTTGVIAGAIYFGSQLLNFSSPKSSTTELAKVEESIETESPAIEVEEPAAIPSFLDELDLESAEPEAQVAAIAEQAPTPSSAKRIPPSDPVIQAYVNQLVVHGLRSAGSNSRLLLSGRVFQVGDVLDPRKGVKFTGVEGTKIRFEDENGAIYLRSK